MRPSKKLPFFVRARGFWPERLPKLPMLLKANGKQNDAPGSVEALPLLGHGRLGGAGRKLNLCRDPGQWA